MDDIKLTNSYQPHSCTELIPNGDGTFRWCNRPIDRGDKHGRKGSSSKCRTHSSMNAPIWSDEAKSETKNQRNAF